MDLLQALKEVESSKMSAALCTVVSIKGSTPRKIGTKMLVIENGDSHGRIIGTIGGGAIEHHIRFLAIKVIKSRKAELVSTSLRNDLGMCCGGEMTLFLEPIIKAPPLLVFGAGHISQALVPMAQSLGFLAYVIDERAELLRLACFKACEKLVDDLTLLNALPFGPEVFVVVATHDHALDQRIIEQVLPHEFLYLALVGSRRKALMTKKRLEAKGVSLVAQQRVICPAGIAINASTPAEIALAIAAQMTKVRNETQEHMRYDSSGRIEQPHGFSQSLDAH